jgi:tight adherence protein B
VPFNPTYLIFGLGAIVTLALMFLAFSGPGVRKAQARRLDSLKGRHTPTASAAVEAQLRKIGHRKDNKMDGIAGRFLPKPALIRLRLSRTGKNWTLGNYMLVSLGIVVVLGGGLLFKGAPFLLCLFVGLAVGLMIPHVAVGMTISKRIKVFNQRFPEAIELMVRGLRSGLPISETIGIVASEVPGPTGEEFRAVGDRVKIGKTLEDSLQISADKIGTPEFQFFCITLNIQRETGGNLAETLSNLANVLRMRAQMKLKIKAMSSESKASAYIVGSLPFIVFSLIYSIDPHYMGGFFRDQRLMIAGGGALIWMSIGGFIMAKMVSFEI